MKRKGLIIVISAPSGGGKTTVIKKLLAECDGLALAVTATSRPMRNGEVDGKDYYFFSKDEFAKKIEEGFFWEHVNYCGNYYGVPKDLTLREIEKGKDLILNIETLGMRAVKKTNPDDVVSVFLMIRSKEELKKRLEGRGDDAAVIADRLSNAGNEAKNYSEYDYCVFNDNVDETVAEIKAIIMAERKKTSRYIGLDELVKKEFPVKR